MAKNILVIDFSYIMYPVIRLYADGVNIEENSTVLWRQFSELYGLDTNILKYDATAYKNIIKLVTKLACKNNSIESAMDMKLLCDEMKLSDETYNITNIDYFDDMDFVDEISDKYNDLNWVNYLYNKDKVESYTWISTSTSRVKSYPESTSISKIDKISETKWDKVLLVFSPLFVPYEYKNLFDIQEIIVNTIKDSKKES